LSGCVTVSFDRPPPSRHPACPPVVAYSADEQAQVAEELQRLPEDAALTEWLADYAVLREQARACVRASPTN
jgi:hypothetical protein